MASTQKLSRSVAHSFQLNQDAEGNLLLFGVKHGKNLEDLMNIGLELLYVLLKNGEFDDDTRFVLLREDGSTQSYRLWSENENSSNQ